MNGSEKCDSCELYRLSAEQCAPVIFGIKPSNLLIINQSCARALRVLVDNTGLKGRCFYRGKDRQIWFMYREDALVAYLADNGNRDFIRQFGYDDEMSLNEMLIHAAKRFKKYKSGEIEFPHEIGIFLGYPLCDVKGFIENAGKNYLCTGYWKVYENEQQAKKVFRSYNRAKQIALSMVNAGKGFMSLPISKVAASLAV